MIYTTKKLLIYNINETIFYIGPSKNILSYWNERFFPLAQAWTRENYYLREIIN